MKSCLKFLMLLAMAFAIPVAVAVAALSPSGGKSEVKSYTNGGYITYTYSDASLLCTVPNTTEGGVSCTSMQGMAIGTTYGYVAKRNGGDVYCDVSRITMSTGAVSEMSYYASLDATSTSSCGYVLGHANELEVVENTSTGTWLFSASTETSKAITRLKIDGTKMYLAGYYDLQLSNGTAVNASALKYVKTVDGNMYFLVKRARNFYTAIIPVADNSGTESNPTVITLYKLFTQDLRNAVFATSNSAYSVEDGIDSWVNQGFGYNADQKVLYVPQWNEDVSKNESDNAIVTYNLADLIVDSYWTDCTDKSYVVFPTKTSFRIYPTDQTFFEIESCSFIPGTTNNLYFNNNATAAYEGVFKIPMSKVDFTPVNDGKAAYTIKYNANGGSGSMSDTYHIYGIGTKIRANTYTLAGSTFGGWYPYRKSDGKWLYTLENGSTKWYLKGEQPTGAHLTLRNDESRVSAVCSVDGDVATYYAQWIPNSTGTTTYYIRYDANGGSGNMAETAVIYGTSTPLRANTYTRSGYTFLGWNVFRHSDSKWIYKSTSPFSDSWLDASADKAGYILKTYKDGGAVARSTSVDTDIVDFYAAWGRVSGGTVPQRLTRGDDFTVGGIIESTTDLYGVKVNIKNRNSDGSDGDIIQTYSTTTYGSRTTSGNGIDLSNANATLDFSTLSGGLYTYEVVVQVIEGSSPYDVTLHSSPFVVGESASKPVADLLDVVFNADGTATDVSSSDMNVTTYADAATLSTAYSDRFDRHTATFAPATANSTISSGFYEISYAGNTEWQSKLEDGFTMECVMRYTVEPSGGLKFFGAQESGGVALYNSGANLFQFAPYVGSDYQYANSHVTPEKDKYYHLVGVYDKTLGQVRMYIDGKPVATVTDVTGDYKHPTNDIARRFVLGGDPNSKAGQAQGAAPCEIVIARIYDAELSDADVDYLYGLQSSALDDTAPVVERVLYEQKDDNSYYIYVYISDNIGVTDVKFHTWTKLNDKDDLAIYEATSGNWHEASDESIKYNWRYLVKREDHNDERGPYTTDIYAYDAAGNQVIFNMGDFAFEGDPVQNLKAAIAFPDGNGSNRQNAVLTWTKPVAGTITGYTISSSIDGGSTYSELITTNTPDVVTYTYENLTQETKFKVEPNYISGRVGDASIVTIAPYEFFGTQPTLNIETIKSTDGDTVIGISHFEATATWSTPIDYQGTGDYLIKGYIVELLDRNGNVIDTKTVDATTGTDIGGGRMSYDLVYAKKDDITPVDGVTVETGKTANGTDTGYFIDDNVTYTSRVRVIYDLTDKLNDASGTSYRYSDVNTAQGLHRHKTHTPIGQVTVYTGTGTAKGAYRIEINIDNAERISDSEDGDPVSHYEVSYTVPGTTEPVALNDFVLLTSDSKTDHSSKVPGTLVRDGNSGKAELDSKTNCFVCYYKDYREYVQPDPNKDEYKWVLQRELTEAEKPTNWTYNLTAVYADDNSLLRTTTNDKMALSDGGTTGEELLESSEEATLKAFPIPAGSTLTVQSPRGIEQITMISASGMVVKDIVGDGNTVMTINVDDLAAGYYMLRVNNQPIIKVVKK